MIGFLLYVVFGLLFTGAVYSGKDANKIEWLSVATVTTLWPLFVLIGTGSWAADRVRRW